MKTRARYHSELATVRWKWGNAKWCMQCCAHILWPWATTIINPTLFAM